MSEIPEFTREHLEGKIGARFHTARHRFSADLYEVDWNGKPALLKDYSGRSWWVRRFWAPALIGREFRTLRRLQGLEGVPRLYGLVGKEALLMERLQARRLPRNDEARPDPALFERLEQLIGELHACGVAHGDLRRMNILMTPEARPYLIDFETAVTAKAGFWGMFKRFGFHRLARVDRVSLAGIKADFYPEALTAAEQELLEATPWYLHTGRFLKKYVYRMKKPHHRRRMWTALRRTVRPRSRRSLIVWEGRPAILKSCIGASVFPYLAESRIDTEHQALTRLEGLAGIPRVYQRIESEALVLQHPPGAPISKVDKARIPPSYFDALRELIQQIHDRGVAHGGLARSKVFINWEAKPFLAGFERAVLGQGSSGGAFTQFRFRRAVRADWNQFAKIRRKFPPSEGEGTEAAVSGDAPRELPLGAPSERPPA